MNTEEQEFYELFGSAFEELGSTRMVGRLIAFLMIGEQGDYTMGEIVTQVGTAKSTVSQTLKVLVQTNFVERFRKPGERADHYRIKENAMGLFSDVVIYKFQRLITLVDESQDLLSHLPAGRTKTLGEMGDMYRFFLEEWPKLSLAWSEKKKNEDQS